MSELQSLVLDASVGVKWFKSEAGRGEALDLLERAVAGEVTLIAPTHFVHEVLSVVRRHYSPDDIVPAWRLLESADITIVPLTSEVIAEAATQCDALGCTFYDALAPACASLLGATLVSADVRAHGMFPGVQLV